MRTLPAILDLARIKAIIDRQVKDVVVLGPGELRKVFQAAHPEVEDRVIEAYVKAGIDMTVLNYKTVWALFRAIDEEGLEALPEPAATALALALSNEVLHLEREFLTTEDEGRAKTIELAGAIHRVLSEMFAETELEN